jgi:gamma-glutamyltranspeptidase/glutathione hydrolase
MPFRGDIRSVTVPGCVDGWIALHTRFGRLPLVEVLRPARVYAESGFPASPTLAAAVADVAHLAAGADYRRGAALAEGDVVRRPGVGRALASLAGGGRDGFYRGEFGAGLLALGGGEYEPCDLARSQADWVDALSVSAWGRQIWTVPPNSQGYLTLAGAWMASGLPLPDDPADPRWAHLLIEAARQAAYDRHAVLHEHADGAQLLSPSRLEPRRATIDIARAARLGDTAAAGGTIALCAVDCDRMGVCLVQSNAAGFGSHLAEPGSGIFLHNRGLGFNLSQDHPGEYGPGRRPAHTLCPTLVTHPDGTLAGVVGTMGGDSQPQILLQLLARWLVSGEAPGDAVGAGRWVVASVEDDTGFATWDRRGRVGVVLEGHAPAAWDEGLRARGHAVVRVPAGSHGFGHAHLITVRDGALEGGSDPRPRFGAALGL